MSSNSTNGKTILIQGLTLAGTYAAKKAVEALINKNTSATIPKKPDLDNNQTWGKALVYAAVTGAVLSTVRLVVSRNAVSNSD